FLTFGCKVWTTIEEQATEPQICASRVDLIFLGEGNNLSSRPVTERLAKLLARESDALWANLQIAPAQLPDRETGHCLRLFLHARGSTPQQAEVRWGFGLAHTQQALLFVARELSR